MPSTAVLGIHIRPYASGATEFALQECGGCFGYCKSCKRGMQFSEKRYVIEGFAAVYIDEYNTRRAHTHTRTHTHTRSRSLAPSSVPSLPPLSLTHKIPLFPRGHVYDSLVASYSNMRRIEYEAACTKFSKEERVPVATSTLCGARTCYGRRRCRGLSLLRDHEEDGWSGAHLSKQFFKFK